MVLAAGLPVGQHYKVATSVHWHKAVSVITEQWKQGISLGVDTGCALAGGLLLKFYVLATSKVMSGRIITDL